MPYMYPKNSTLTPNLQAVVALLGGVIKRLSKFEQPDTKSDIGHRNVKRDRRHKGKAAPQTPHRG